MHWWKITGNDFGPVPWTSRTALAYRMKWKTKESTHCHAVLASQYSTSPALPTSSDQDAVDVRRAYRFSKRTLRSRLVALTHSELCDACSAAISHSVFIAAAECRTGMETRARTPATIWASRNVQVPYKSTVSRNALNIPRCGALGGNMLTRCCQWEEEA